MATSNIKKPETYVKAVDFFVRTFSATYTLPASSYFTVDFGNSDVTGYQIIGVYEYNTGAPTGAVANINPSNSSGHATMFVANTSATQHANKTAYLKLSYAKVT